MTDRTPDPANSPVRVGVPGIVLISVGALAFVVCVTAFALAWIAVGTWAGILALLSSAAGLAWLTDEGRRQRGSRPLMPLRATRRAGND